jgi:hypothetical protein
LTTDKSHHREMEEKRNNATAVLEGETVRIDNKIYGVHLLKEGYRYSDGIQFLFQREV